MAKKNEIEKILPAQSQQPAGGALMASRPTFLSSSKPEGLDAMGEYVILPRAKIVQKQASAELLQMFGTGDLILSPLNMPIVKIGRNQNGAPEPRGPAFYFTPIYFFVDWATWNPIALKGKEPAIAYRTSDPKDQIVAKSRNKDLRKEAILDANGKPMLDNGQPLFRRHVEHLNWIVRLHGHDLQDPFIIGFSKGEHFAGRKFAGAIRMRNASPFGCVFEGHTQYRPPRSGGDWYGIDAVNPSEESGVLPWVNEEQFALFQAMYREFDKIYKGPGLRADMTDADDVQAVDDLEPVEGGQRDM